MPDNPNECGIQAEYKHPLTRLLEFIQEHLGCAVTVSLGRSPDRILADCVKCCHSRNIPLGSIESFLRTVDPVKYAAQAKELAGLKHEMDAARLENQQACTAMNEENDRHIARIDTLFGRLKDLEAENAKLRAALEDAVSKLEGIMNIYPDIGIEEVLAALSTTATEERM